MLDVQVFEVNGLLGWKRVENALEQGPMLVTMHPMLMYAGLHLFKVEAGERVEGEPEPVFPIDHKVTDKQTLCCSRQIQDPDHVVHFASASGTDGTL